MSTEPLVFSGSADLQKRLQFLFDRFDNEPASVTKFLDNPVDAVVRDLLPEVHSQVTPASVSAASRFMYSALANPAFAKWAKETHMRYDQLLQQPENRSAKPEDLVTREAFLQELGEALIKSGDSTLVANALSASSLRGSGDRAVAIDEIAVVRFAVAILVVAITAIDVTPRTINPNLGLTISPDLIRSLSEKLTAHIS